MTPTVVPAELQLGNLEIRPGTEADAVGGQVPAWVAAPASTEQASALLRAAAELSLAVVFRGSGTRLDWGVPPVRCDLVIETRLLDAVLEHAAGDLVVRVQAGVPLDTLAARLATAGQRLALDPLADGGGTVGGLVATGLAGPLRLRFGAPRDLLIGITIVRADGTVAKAGGKVVKNVAGYDLGKLLAGSYGTLGLITEATFRLHPLPRAVSSVTVSDLDPEDAARAALDAAGSPLAPSAVELSWPAPAAPLAVSVLLEGDPDGVAERTARLRALLPGAEADDAPPDWWGRGPAHENGTLLRIAFWAGRLGSVLAAVRDAAAQAGVDPAVTGSAAGVLHANLSQDTPAEAVHQFISALRTAVSPASPAPGPAPAGLIPVGFAGPELTLVEATPADAASLAGLTGGSVVVLHAPPPVREAVDPWGPAPAQPLMQAIKNQFDPEHRLAPGRFAGGI
jgi:glycolate oxidase FAD binding subunit